MSGTLRDEQGNLVPIESVRATQNGHDLDCTLSGSEQRDAGGLDSAVALEGVELDGGAAAVGTVYLDPWAQRTTDPFTFTCVPRGPGEVQVELTAEGQTLRRHVEVEKKKSTDEWCEDFVAAENADLALKGPGCSPDNATAVQGVFLNARGEPAVGWLSIVLNHDQTVQAPCEIGSGTFRCPALTAYSAHYTLEGTVDSSRLAIPIHVTGHECTLNTVTAEIDLSNSECAERRPALQANFFAECADQAEEPGARAKVADGDFVDCEVVFANPHEDECLFTFTCQALTRTGGGTYTLELSQGEHRVTVEREVTDDGCSPITNTDNVLSRLN